MKRPYTFIFFLSLISTLAWSQADLVVGTNYKLNIQRKNSAADAYILQNANYSSGSNTLAWDTSHPSFGLRGIRFNYQSGIHFYANSIQTVAGNTFTPTTTFFIGNNGRIGLGTTAPADKLHVAGGSIIVDNGGTPSIFTGTGSTELNRYLRLVNSTGLGTPSGLKAGGVLVANNFTYANPAKGDMVVQGKMGIGNTLASNPNNHTLIVGGTLNTTGLYVNDQLFVSSPWAITTGRINYGGQVAIGTSLASNPNNYTLAVNGKIGAKDMQIENSSSTWPDYVFEDGYPLPSLSEVESYILENRHLEGMPSAAEVDKKGYSVNEFNLVLLRKVEELTLYLVQQQKEINQLRQELEEVALDH